MRLELKPWFIEWYLSGFGDRLNQNAEHLILLQIRPRPNSAIQQTPIRAGDKQVLIGAEFGAQTFAGRTPAKGLLNENRCGASASNDC